MTQPWSLNPLSPKQNGTIAATNATARIALGGPENGNPNGPFSVQVANIGTKEAFIKFGDVTVVATAQGAVTAAADGDTSIPTGSILTFSVYSTHVAAITAGSDTTTLRFCLGIGS